MKKLGFIFLFFSIFFIYTNAQELATIATATVPEKYASVFDLFLPQQDLIVNKDKVLVKGANRFLTDIFINGERILLREDGRFYYYFKLPKAGKHNLLISFLTSDYQVLNLQRKILYLKRPKNLEKYSGSQEKELLYFCNTRFFNSSQKEPDLAANLTRADLAYFIAQITKASLEEVKTETVFNDISKEYWAASSIQYVVEQQIMAEYPDGEFKPEYPVKKLEYIISMTRALKCALNKEEIKLPYRDVSKKHWTAKYIAAALENNLITAEKILNPKQVLTVADFVFLVKDRPEIKEAIVDLLDFTKGYAFDQETEDNIWMTINTFIEEKQREVAAMKKIEIIKPGDKEAVYEDSVLFEGDIFPPVNFTINEHTVEPTVEGLFSKKITDLAEGENTLLVKALDQELLYKIYYLKPYLDTKGHWIEKMAAQLRYLGLIKDKGDYFYPHKKMTRADLAKTITDAFALEKLSTENVYIRDVEGAAPNYDAIQTVLEQKIFTLDKDSNFHPNRSVSRIVTLTALLRAVKIEMAEDSLSNTVVPFRDVSARHWGRKYMRIALENGLISKARYFYPKRTAVKAEVYAIIGKILGSAAFPF
jgi:hypothetical protein